jgi:HK97 gp10 family phage protein
MAALTQTHVVIFDDAAVKSTDTAEAREYLGRLAEEGARHAQENAPVATGYVSPSHEPPGSYRDSISSEITSGAHPQARVEAGTSYWRWVEFGSIHNRPFRILSEALIYMTDRQEFDRA